jgi:S1-C subfamily serine protease
MGISGGALLNLEGKLVGINCGYFDERCTYFEVKQQKNKDDVVDFDMNVRENDESYVVKKEFNVGIDIRHSIFKEYIKENKQLV